MLPKFIRKRLDIRNAKLNKGPLYLTIFVTNKCNLRCAHCFYHNEIAKNINYITTEDVKKILDGISKRLTSVIITGGEPVMNDDVEGICLEILNNTSCGYLDFDSNAYAVSLLMKRVRGIVSKTDKLLNVQISLDGFKDTHDKIRGVEGAYEKVIESVSGIKEMMKEFKNLSCCLLTTVNKANHKEVLKLRDFVKRELGIPHNFSIVRGISFGVGALDNKVISDFEPEEDFAKLPAYDELLDLYKKLYNQPDLTLNQQKQKMKFKVALDVLAKERRIIECYAGYIDGVIYPNLDVSLCEFTKPIGNLREFNYDFNKLWFSPKAVEMRLATRKCHCIHSCNILHSLRYQEPFY